MSENMGNKGCIFSRWFPLLLLNQVNDTDMIFLKNLLLKFYPTSIRQKLNLSFGILVSVTLLVVSRNYWSSIQATQHIQRTQALRMPTVLASSYAQEELMSMLSNIRGYLVTGESELRYEYQNSRQAFEQHLSNLEQLLATLDAVGNDQRLDKIQKQYQDWSSLPEKLFALRDNPSRNQPALNLLEKEGEVLTQVILRDIREVLVAQTQRSPSIVNMQLLQQLSEFQSSFSLMTAALQSYTVTREPTFRFAYSTHVKQNEAVWQALRQQEAFLTRDQQATMTAIQKHRQQFLLLVPQVMAIAEGDRYRGDLFLYQSQIQPLAEEMLVLLEEIVEYQRQALATELRSSNRNLTMAQWQTLLGGGIALLLAILMAFLLRRHIAIPVQRLTAISDRIATGDLDVKAPVDSEDELGTLAMTFNKMTSALKASRHELENYSHTLEHRVAMRTEELQEKNQQLKQALRDLKKTQSQLIQTEKMSSLGQMVAGVAHEINNPVNFIYGNLDYASRYIQDLLDLVMLYQREIPQPPAAIKTKIEAIDLVFLEEDLPKLLNSMKMGSDRIREIVLSLRNFSRLDEADLKTVNLHEGIDNALVILQNKLKTISKIKPIKVIKDYGELPLIECYAGQLNQVFLNILSNAIDAIAATLTPAQADEPATATVLQTVPAPQITIQTTVLEPDWVRITMTDNGMGMSEEIRQRLFEPFFTTKEVGQGTGLGLAISYQIVVERHGGRLHCSSALGQYTTFTIEIPTHQIQPQPQPVALYSS